MKTGQSLLKNSFEDVFDNAISSGSNGWTVYVDKKTIESTIPHHKSLQY